MSDSSTTLPQRTERISIDAARRFRIDAVFIDENTRLKEWLAQRANEELGAFGVNAREHAPRIAARAPSIVEEVALVFGVGGEHRIVPALLNDARNGTFQTHIPSRALIAGVTILLALAVAGEVIVGVLQVLLSDAGGAVIFQSVLLAVAAGLAGLGLGGLLKRSLARSIPAAWKALPSEAGRGRHLSEFVVGLAAVGGLVIVRCYGLEAEERLVVATLSIFLSALVIILEVLRGYHDTKYQCLWWRMFDAQVWDASERHRNARAFYEAHFMAQVEALAEGKGTTRGTLVAAE